jgi:sulfatase maturation enzyme AslB (radical SAM superfamily)
VTRRLAIRALDVVLTSACNLRCAYCYQGRHGARRMSWGTLRAAADRLLSSRHPERTLAFYGGEPLLARPLLERAVEHVERRCGNRRVQFTVATNGTLLDAVAARFLAAHGVRTALSFDGVAQAQERRGTGTFTLLDARLDALRRDEPVFFKDRLEIALTLTGANLPFLASSVDYLLSKDVRTIKISPLLTHDPDWTERHEEQLDRQLEAVRAASLAFYRARGRVPVQVLHRTAERRASPPPRSSWLCGVPRGDALTVDVDGQVTGCVLFVTSYQQLTPWLASRLQPMRLGDVRDPELPARVVGDRAAARAAEIFDRRALKRSGARRCRECELAEGCVVCPVSIAHQPGAPDPHRIPDAHCSFNRLVAKHRALFPVQPSLAELVAGQVPVLPPPADQSTSAAVVAS